MKEEETQLRRENSTKKKEEKDIVLCQESIRKRNIHKRHESNLENINQPEKKKRL
jgi:hypothetical protein